METDKHISVQSPWSPDLSCMSYEDILEALAGLARERRLALAHIEVTRTVHRT